MKKILIKKISTNCSLLNNPTIKEEIKLILNGYKLKKINETGKEYNYSFMKEKEEYALLTTIENKAEVIKLEKNKAEKMTIVEQPLIFNNKVEKKSNGIVITIIKKYFSTLEFPCRTSELISLSETKYFIQKELIEKIQSKKFEDIELDICLEMAEKVNLEDYSIYQTTFDSYINYNWQNSKNACPTKIYFNGNDISGMYASINGKNRIYRIHDLYNGITNHRNSNDIVTIAYGKLRAESFDLRKKMGITELEEKLIGDLYNPDEIIKTDKLNPTYTINIKKRIKK